MNPLGKMKQEYSSGRVRILLLILLIVSYVAPNDRDRLLEFKLSTVSGNNTEVLDLYIHILNLFF